MWGSVLLYGVLGLFGGGLTFIVVFVVLSNISDGLGFYTERAEVVVGALSVTIALSVVVLISVGGYYWDKGVDVVGLQLLDDTKYIEEENKVTNIADTSSKQHPNRFTVTFEDGSTVEVPRSNVKVITFGNGKTTEIKQKNDGF